MSRVIQIYIKATCLGINLQYLMILPPSSSSLQSNAKIKCNPLWGRKRTLNFYFSTFAFSNQYFIKCSPTWVRLRNLKNFLTTLEIFKNILVRWWGGGGTLVSHFRPTLLFRFIFEFKFLDFFLRPHRRGRAILVWFVLYLFWCLDLFTFPNLEIYCHFKSSGH